MHTDSEHINIEFHESARRIYFSLIEDFKASVAGINRKKNEYLFQQLLEKFVNTMKQQLESVAKEAMTKYPAAQNIEGINLQLNHSIADYLHQFLQKIRSL